MFSNTATALPQVLSGNVKAFAVTAKHRLAVAPDIPSVDEVGLLGLYFSLWRGHRTASREPEACGVTTIPPALALPLPVAALPYALALAPTAESSPGTKNFFAKTSSHKGYPLYGQNHFWTGFCQRGHEQFSEFKSPPYRGAHLPHAHQAGLRCGEPSRPLARHA